MIYIIIAVKLLIIISGLCLAISLVDWGRKLWKGQKVDDPKMLATVLWIIAFFTVNSVLGLIYRLFVGGGM